MSRSHEFLTMNFDQFICRFWSCPQYPTLSVCLASSDCQNTGETRPNICSPFILTVLTRPFLAWAHWLSWALSRTRPDQVWLHVPLRMTKRLWHQAWWLRFIMVQSKRVWGTAVNWARTMLYVVFTQPRRFQLMCVVVWLRSRMPVAALGNGHSNWRQKQPRTSPFSCPPYCWLGHQSMNPMDEVAIARRIANWWNVNMVQ